MSLPVPLKVLGGSGGGVVDVANGGTFDFSYIGGEHTSSDWEGTPRAMYNEYQAQKLLAVGNSPWWDSCKMHWHKGKANLHCESVADGQVYWELIPNEYRPPIWQHPYFLSGGTCALTVAQLAAVRLAWQQGQTLTVAGSVTAAMVKLQSYMLSGVTEFPQMGWVLRSTFNGSLRSTSTIKKTEINTVVTPPTSAAAQAMIGDLPAGEWLYKGGNVCGYQLGRFQQIQEWWWIALPPGWPKFLGGSFDP
jgi:hypothetical protein